jgi:hypothetical protein
MTSGWLLFGIGTAVAAGDLLASRWFMRIARRNAGTPLGLSGSPAGAARALRFGALTIFLIFAAIGFGLIHLPNVQPIQLH